MGAETITQSYVHTKCTFWMVLQKQLQRLLQNERLLTSNFEKDLGWSLSGSAAIFLTKMTWKILINTRECFCSNFPEL